jgi:hypothetical protein
MAASFGVLEEVAMANRRTKTICTTLIDHGIDPAKAQSLAEDLEERLQEQTPEWNWRELRTAWKNPASAFAIGGLLLTAAILYVTLEQTLFGQAAPADRRLPLLPSLVVAGWLVLPPLYFFVELYFRGTSKEAREMVQTYQQAAQRIWLAVAAVLVALCGLSFKV